MVKKLTKHGKRLVLEMEPSLLDLLKIGADTLLDISTDGRMLFIGPVRDEGEHKAFQEALEQANQKYRHALERLAE